MNGHSTPRDSYRASSLRRPSHSVSISFVRRDNWSCCRGSGPILDTALDTLPVVAGGCRASKTLYYEEIVSFFETSDQTVIGSTPIGCTTPTQRVTNRIPVPTNFSVRLLSGIFGLGSDSSELYTRQRGETEKRTLSPSLETAERMGSIPFEG